MTNSEILDDILHHIEVLMSQLDDKQSFIKYFGYDGKMWWSARSGSPYLGVIDANDQLYACINYPQSGGAYPLLYMSIKKKPYKTDKRVEPPIHSLRDKDGDITGAEDIHNYDDFYICIQVRKLRQLVWPERWEVKKDDYKIFLSKVLDLPLLNADSIASMFAGGQ